MNLRWTESSPSRINTTSLGRLFTTVVSTEAQRMESLPSPCLTRASFGAKPTCCLVAVPRVVRPSAVLAGFDRLQVSVLRVIRAYDLSCHYCIALLGSRGVLSVKRSRTQHNQKEPSASGPGGLRNGGEMSRHFPVTFLQNYLLTSSCTR